MAYKNPSSLAEGNENQSVLYDGARIKRAEKQGRREAAPVRRKSRRQMRTKADKKHIDFCRVLTVSQQDFLQGVDRRLSDL